MERCISTPLEEVVCCSIGANVCTLYMTLHFHRTAGRGEAGGEAVLQRMKTSATMCSAVKEQLREAQNKALDPTQLIPAVVAARSKGADVDVVEHRVLFGSM